MGPGPFEMTQKPVPQPVSFVRTLDEAGHIGDDKAPMVTEFHDAEVWCQRRKRIGGNLGPGGRDVRDERGLARVGKSDEADIGEQLELKPERASLPGLAGLHLARGTIGRRDKHRVAQPAASALGHQHPLALFGQVGHAHDFAVRQLFEDEGPHGNVDDEVFRRQPGSIRALAVISTTCFELGMKAEVDERVAVGRRRQVDGAAGSAVAAVRAASRHELLPAEAETAASTVACGDTDLYFVNKHSFSIGAAEKNRRLKSRARFREPGPRKLLGGDDADPAATGTMVLELDRAGHLREQRVVLAQSDVEAWAELAPALAHQDGPARDDIAVVTLDAEPLRVAVAAVA